MDKALIEKLKKPELAQPFGLLTDEERGILETAGPSQCQILSESGKWEAKQCRPYSFCYAYILKPNYDPEFEKIPVEVDSHRHLRCNGVWIDCLSKDQGFRGFFYDDGGTPCRTTAGRVAEHYAKGLKVYARFVKEG